MGWSDGMWVPLTVHSSCLSYFLAGRRASRGESGVAMRLTRSFQIPYLIADIKLCGLVQCVYRIIDFDQPKKRTKEFIPTYFVRLTQQIDPLSPPITPRRRILARRSRPHSANMQTIRRHQLTQRRYRLACTTYNACGCDCGGLRCWYWCCGRGAGSRALKRRFCDIWC